MNQAKEKRTPHAVCIPRQNHVKYDGCSAQRSTLDSIDAGIIREFSGPEGNYQWDVRQSYSRIARKLGVDEETVRRRIRRSERSGLIGGGELILNPYLIGREPVRVVLNVANHEKRKRTVVSQIGLIDGVLLILDMQGPAMQVLLFCENEEAVTRRTRLITSISGCEDPVILRNLDALGFRRCNLKPTQTDLKILKSLRKNPRKSMDNVAREVGVSKRTIERRIAHLTQNSAFFHMLRLDFRKSQGVLCSLIVSYGDERQKSRLDATIASKVEKLFYSATAAKAVSIFNFACDNVAESEAIREFADSLEGVIETKIGFIREYILVSDWLDTEIERMLSQS
jgi:DNA-binding Lrp family transcriptional regulator